MTDDEWRELLAWGDNAMAQLRADLAATEPDRQARLAAINAEGDKVLAALRAQIAAQDQGRN